MRGAHQGATLSCCAVLVLESIEWNELTDFLLRRSELNHIRVLNVSFSTATISARARWHHLEPGILNPEICGLRIWRSFIPLSSFGVFQRGGYFIVDVIPDTLAVISLNTIYFYDSNKGESERHICSGPTFRRVPNKPSVVLRPDPSIQGACRSWSPDPLILHHYLIPELIKCPLSSVLLTD